MGKNRWWTTVRVLFSFLMAAVLAWGLVACGDRIEATEPLNTDGSSKTQLRGSLSEEAPPPVIQQLSQTLDAYQPQVSIVSPNPDQVLQETTVSVKLQVQDLPIFKDPDFELGPHLHVILDNQPYKAIYNLDQPLVFEDLAPGTHTLRVFASRPWHESFKNEGAYAQTTFHIFTKTDDNNPDPALPLLTYSRPTGSYGAEPIMLDFYLTNAPLHLVAQENPDDNIADWRIRVTVNGESFVLDRWEPIYLKGFKLGKNWVQLEFLDEQGNPVKNAFNDTVRLIDYEPKGKDSLSKLVRGQISAAAAAGIVDPDYKTKAKLTPLPDLAPSPEETPEPIPSFPPAVEETPTAPATPEAQPTPPAEPVPTEAKQAEKPKSGGFFGRFRRPDEAPTPSPEPVVPEQPELEPLVIPSESPASVEQPTPMAEPVTPEVPTKQAEIPEIPEPKAEPKLNLKEVLLPPAASSTPPKIIQAPDHPESGIPKRFLKQSTPTEPESSDLPATDSQTTDVPVEAAIPELP